ncbi:VWA domain-containing protein [Saccharothrix texasensis]|uniref:Ca-activated chloride channel family protein n=1 Tax=Saccharothrix texasensis TaxID=103734 RepID=A0A3N1GZK3_9PSEU|nr:VWA domain-containing protein [Saccharothrix texasensis]ROP35536.1 Ca-activated chloride channel family protein [Saccharothrix texasensis]
MRTAFVLAAALVVAGCTAEAGPDPARPAEPGVLRVLAGSELTDLRPVLDAAAEATGVEVEFTFTGTLEGAEALAKGEVDGEYDAVWFSSNRYPAGIPEAARRLGTQVEVMSSPVVLGLSTSSAKRLGWADRRVGWGEIAEQAGRKAFTYGMTDPSASNSGFSALVGVASALAGAGAAVDADQIAAVTPRLKDFFAAQSLSAGSSGWLSEAYQRRATGQDPGARVDGLVNYESVLLSMNAAGTLPEPLTLVYPDDGVVTADYPLTLLADAGDDARDAHRRLTDHLRTPDVQREIARTTHRRPVVPGVELDPRFAVRDLVELPFPVARDAVEGLLSAYFDELRRPSRTLYVLDTSGSMAGDRIASLRSALVGLTGADDSLTGRFRRFRSREEVTLLPFDTTPGEPRTFTLPEGDPRAELAEIKAYAEALAEGGGTAIYDSLSRAYRVMEPLVAADPDRFTSIVLMTDGENANGSGLAEFQASFGSVPASVRQVPVFTVLFGEGSGAELGQVAAMTGGKVFDARAAELGDVFQEIRGYQ